MAIRPAGIRISEFFGDKPDYGALGSQATSEDARGYVNTALNNAKTAATAMRAEADRAAGEHYADATRSIGATQASASLFGDVADAVGIAGGAAMKKWSPFNKPAVDADGYQIGKFGDTYGGYGGKYGSMEDPTESFKGLGLEEKVNDYWG